MGRHPEGSHRDSSQRSGSRFRSHESYEVRQERERVERERRLDDDGFPAPKRPRRDARQDDIASQSGASVASWRSAATSRRTRDQMVGGHVIPQLEEAVKSGGILMFKRSSTAKPKAVLEAASHPAPAAMQTDAPVELSHEESEFVKQLADEISEKSSRDMERDWYTQGDGDVGLHSTSLFDDSILEFREKESRYKRDHERLKVKKGMTFFRQEDDLWEKNRLATAGIEKSQVVPTSFQSLEDETRDVVITKDAKPAFLLDTDVQEVQNSEISIVKDPTSDMAKLARKGSAALARLKEETEKTKLKDRFWELAGTTLGKVLGVTDESSLETQKALEEMEKVKPFTNLGASLVNADYGASPEQILKQRARLPIADCKTDLMRVIRDHSVVVIVGETGSGKTTQLTQYLYEAGYGRRPATSELGADEDDEEEATLRRHTRTGIVGCTQPRRVAAVSVAKRVAEEMGCKLGKLVGYSIRFEDCTTPEITRIKYMTDAFLLREILSDPDLDRYQAIIMDEAHERSLATDVLFGLLRDLAARRFDFKLIVTSATMNAQRFAEFFGGCPIYTIPGRTFPVQIEFARSPCPDYVDGAVQKCLQIHFSSKYDLLNPSDILVFMTGQEDIEGTCILLSERVAQLQHRMDPLSVLPIYSQLSADLQAKVFERSVCRKVIVATNIAETSLTLDGIRYVVDAGFCKVKLFTSRIGMDTLQLTPISRANANQRAGRAGRTAPGICYRLYTETAYLNEMLENQIPEIQRTNLAHVVLLLKSLKVADLLAFPFMDPPPRETILSAMLQLWLLGALDEEGELTSTGMKMAHLPVDSSLARMILLSAKLQCVSELLTIVAMLSVPSIFYRPKGRAEEADAAREKFAVPESDHLTMLNIYTQWIANKCSPSWSTKHFIHQKSLARVRSVREQLTEITKGQNIILTTSQDWDCVRKAVCSGYFHHTAKLKGLGEYVNLRTSLPCHLHPTSALFQSGMTPEYVVYHEVTVTTKEYMQNVTAIDPNWLQELAPQIYTIRRAGKS
eukprot:Blabericola_migrator_1__13451@NODE_969_length_5870_cov_76_745476_g671_i0_p1_GENE_NODE_969_length_5870_cov_76_745476_g671_i0NODE_969_length_5870_cov_76_745476_g671_i0_p1_ORF_typecomplete_len1023_score164_89HA2/PF04408_23/3e29Flavi_DEAD/PF07652_14/0_22Flavi_DEAD/PF07652_14/2_7e21OB_NTP_bind/PF07717_16/5_1e03OB_NTP_bind/PF07717_16/1_7e21DEAD/PF00270_29/1_4e12DEAD/PF00270_29/1e03Helicase_C/PF00271_31/3_5e09AAA_22/PF13401_6/5_5e09AAA_19/PF13245_6/6_6e09AAA_25/PF13481_6/0_0016T2SSE/PF00437_20/0_0022DU